MYDIGSAALAQLARSHRTTGRLVASVNRSPFTYPVKLDDGDVSVSSASPIRRTLDATIHASINAPECDVFQTEIRAEKGIYLPTGEIVWVPLGTFVVTDAKKSGRGRVDIKGVDRWFRVQESRFLQPITTSGAHIAAITSMLTGADGRITVVNKTTNTSNHPRMLWERDRDKAVLQLAKSVGVVVVFNPLGVAEIRNVANIYDTDPVWNVNRGDGGVLIETNEERSRGNTYNAVVAEGEGSDGTPPVRAVATISDVNSKLLFGGGFGMRPRFYRSPLMTTEAQCQKAADALLSRVSGVSKKLTVDAFSHPVWTLMT